EAAGGRPGEVAPDAGRVRAARGEGREHQVGGGHHGPADRRDQADRLEGAEDAAGRLTADSNSKAAPTGSGLVRLRFAERVGVVVEPFEVAVGPAEVVGDLV